MANKANLKSWKPGQSGNPSGKPKGSKHLSTRIRELLADESFERKLKDGTLVTGAPVDAIINVLIEKGVKGDLKAIDLIAKYGWGTHVDVTSDDRPMIPITPLALNVNLPERR